jgi:hypothetical protein
MILIIADTPLVAAPTRGACVRAGRWGYCRDAPLTTP